MSSPPSEVRAVSSRCAFQPAAHPSRVPALRRRFTRETLRRRKQLRAHARNTSLTSRTPTRALPPHARAGALVVTLATLVVTHHSSMPARAPDPLAAVETADRASTAWALRDDEADEEEMQRELEKLDGDLARVKKDAAEVAGMVFIK